MICYGLWSKFTIQGVEKIELKLMLWWCHLVIGIPKMYSLPYIQWSVMDYDQNSHRNGSWPLTLHHKLDSSLKTFIWDLCDQTNNLMYYLAARSMLDQKMQRSTSTAILHFQHDWSQIIFAPCIWRSFLQGIIKLQESKKHQTVAKKQKQKPFKNT